ncbi:CD99 molecule isoform X2 [Clupea harengus]|uniref:CD99 molecule isoform X2 n=1 Tax=Clupea harengus TaxID=7950 RepID=A0A8M1K578_CLUHA|nr:CD99 molecule isoform X2 [Clupea harengus]
MTSFVWIVVLASLVATKAQDFDLTDALGDLDMVTEKPPLPKEPDAPKSPEPAAPAGGEGDLDLNDAFGGADDTPTEPKKPAGGNPDPTEPKKPTGGDLDLNDAFGGPGGFDLSDALGPDPEPEKPAVIPPKDGGTGGTGGGTFDDSDLFDVGGGGSDYKPDKGKGGARPSDPGHNEPAADQPAEAGSGPLAGIISAVGLALLGAASSFFAYQKKKLCFKIQGGVDPESGKHHQGTESEPQVLSNLLRSS